MFADVKDRLRVALARNEFVAKVAEATNEDPWGPTGPQMEELTQIFGDGRAEIVEELQVRLQVRKESWRKCYKSLLLIEYMLSNISEVYIDDLRIMAPLVSEVSRTFHFVDSSAGDSDHGLSVRERAKKVHALMVDEEALREARAKALKTRQNCSGMGSGPGIVTSASAPGRGRSVEAVPPPGGHRGGGGDIGGAAPLTAASLSASRSSTAERLRREQEMQDHLLAMRLQQEEEKQAHAAAGANRGGDGAPHRRGVASAPKAAAAGTGLGSHVAAARATPLHSASAGDGNGSVSMHHVPDAAELAQIDEDHRIAMALERGEDPFAGRSAPAAARQGTRGDPAASGNGAPPLQQQQQQQQGVGLSFLDDIFSAPPAAQQPPPPPPQPQPQPHGEHQQQQQHQGLDLFGAAQPAQPTHQGLDLFGPVPLAPSAPAQPLQQQQQPIPPPPMETDIFGAPASTALQASATRPLQQPQPTQQSHGALEQQVAAFSGVRAAPASDARGKTLDEILAERRQAPTW